jgi:hypothetical protein
MPHPAVTRRAASNHISRQFSLMSPRSPIRQVDKGLTFKARRDAYRCRARTAMIRNRAQCMVAISRSSLSASSSRGPRGARDVAVSFVHKYRQYRKSQPCSSACFGARSSLHFSLNMSSVDAKSKHGADHTVVSILESPFQSTSPSSVGESRRRQTLDRSAFNSITAFGFAFAVL